MKTDKELAYEIVIAEKNKAIEMLLRTLDPSYSSTGTKTIRMTDECHRILSMKPDAEIAKKMIKIIEILVEKKHGTSWVGDYTLENMADEALKLLHGITDEQQ